jgi:hypothetical protein
VVQPFQHNPGSAGMTIVLSNLMGERFHSLTTADFAPHSPLNRISTTDKGRTSP